MVRYRNDKLAPLDMGGDSSEDDVPVVVNTTNDDKPV